MSKNSGTKLKWSESGNIYRTQETSNQLEKLPVAIYTIGMNPLTGPYLLRHEDKYEFPFKVYGIESKFIKRIRPTFESTKSNIGILLHGIKGTGKTITAKMICNDLNLPVIMITENFKGLVEFLNTFQQDVIFFFDEFEKTFQISSDANTGASTPLLTIMDGALKNSFRKVFILTANELKVENNLLQRPGRIRYLKQFGNLELDSIIKIVDDKLVNKQFRNEIIKFISQLELITVDIVSEIVIETNIHDEPPNEFASIFNVKKLPDKVDIYKIEFDPFLKKNREVMARSFTAAVPMEVTRDNIGQNFSFGGATAGKIVKVESSGRFHVENQIYNEEDKIENVTTVYRIEKSFVHNTVFDKYEF